MRFSYLGIVDVVVPQGFEELAAICRRELLEQDVREAASCIEIVVGDEDDLHAPRTTFGVAGALGPNGETLATDGRGHFCEVSLDDVSVGDLSTRLRVCCRSYSAAALLEWLVIPLAQFVVAGRGFAPIHASGVAFGARPAYVFSAWAGVGKTNLVLAGMQLDETARYLGDDIVTVSADGRALASSRTISAYGYNRQLLPDSAKTSARMRVGERLQRVGSARRLGRLGPIVVYAGNALSNQRLDVRRPRRASEVSTHDVGFHFRCFNERVGRELVVRKSRFAPDAAAAAHLAVMDFEFVQFRRFLDASEWGTGRPLGLWGSLRETWRPTLAGYFDAVPAHHELAIPRVAEPRAEFASLWGSLRAL